MPVRGLELLIRAGGIQSARSVLTGQEYEIRDAGTRIHIPELGLNDVVVLHTAPC